MFCLMLRIREMMDRPKRIKDSEIIYYSLQNINLNK